MTDDETVADSLYGRDEHFAEAKIPQDQNFYKTIIRRLKNELRKVKSENEQLRKTVVAYSVKLPQVSRKLNALVSCLEASVCKLNQHKERKSNDERGESSVESILSQEDDRACDEVRDGGSEEDNYQTTTTTDSGVNHSMQNFVEVICEEEISIQDTITSKGRLQNGTPSGQNYKERKSKGDGTIGNDVKSSHSNSAEALPQGTKSHSQEKVKILKEKHENRNAIKKMTKKNNKQRVMSNTQSPRQLEEPQCASKESECQPRAVLFKEKAGGVVSEVMKEESQDGYHMMRDDTSDNPNGSNQLQLGLVVPNKSVINVGSSTGAVGVSDSGIVYPTLSLGKRGRRRAYDCEVCGRSFARSSNLSHHVMRHRNERPHQCDICDRAFVQKSNLKVHLRSHTGERPFSCPECGRAFAQKNNALRHFRTHVRRRQLQEQKLMCPVCSKTFGRWPSYESHMRKAHGNSESSSVVTTAHCMIEKMVTDSAPTVGPSRIGEANVSNPQIVVGITHHSGNVVDNSPIGPAHIDHIHPPHLSLANAHQGDVVTTGPLLPQVYHQTPIHLIVVGDPLSTPPNIGHGCGGSTC